MKRRASPARIHVHWFPNGIMGARYSHPSYGRMLSYQGLERRAVVRRDRRQRSGGHWLMFPDSFNGEAWQCEKARLYGTVWAATRAAWRHVTGANDG